MRTCRVCVVFGVTLFLVGCGAAPPALPPGLTQPNCVTIDHRMPSADNFEKVETVVIARCTEVRQYATVRDGNYEHSWCLLGFAVITVERGTWPQDRIVFCCYETWLTPESGVMYDLAPFPFFQGGVTALALVPQTEPPRVVGYQERSLVPPYGKPRPVIITPGSQERKQFYDRLWAAVRGFAERSGGPPLGGARGPEETDDAYVLLLDLRTDGPMLWRTLSVDKETFAVREVP